MAFACSLTRRSRLAVVTALALLPALLHGNADAQLFFATHPQPGFAVGPLFIQGMVGPDRPDVAVEIIFSLVIPADRSALEFEQDLFVLWPGDVRAPASVGDADPTLIRTVEAHGFSVLEAGRLPLVAQRHFEPVGGGEPVAGGAPFVTFVRSGGPLGLTAPATYIRVPWTPRLANPAWLMSIQLTAPDLLRPRPTTWVSRIFAGPREILTLSFGDVGPPAAFAMYFGQRDRVIPLRPPARLLVNFAAADRLAIDEIAPPSSRREPSQSLDNTVLVSRFLEPGDTISPQALTVQFGYFSRLQSWGPVVIPALFFALGNVAGVLIRAIAERLRRRLAGRVQVGRRWVGRAGRDSGPVLSRERLAQLVPGETTYEEVVARCGRPSEEREGLATPGRKTLIYRGRRDVPQRRWSWGWLATVSHWDVEHHEVEITVEGRIVQDIQARVRRARMPDPSAA
jgi:hypothetical protein